MNEGSLKLCPKRTPANLAMALATGTLCWHGTTTSAEDRRMARARLRYVRRQRELRRERPQI
jgi:hypothetical protein